MRFYSQASCLRDTYISLFSRGIEIEEHHDQHYYCGGPIRYTLEDLLLEVNLDVELTERAMVKAIVLYLAKSPGLFGDFAKIHISMNLIPYGYFITSISTSQESPRNLSASIMLRNCFVKQPKSSFPMYYLTGMERIKLSDLTRHRKMLVRMMELV